MFYNSLWVVLVSVVGGLVSVCSAKSFVSEGSWSLNHVEDCENPEQYPYRLSFEKRKINRTHDRLNIDANFPEELTIAMGIHVDVYVLCEGGYKHSQNLTDPSFCGLLNKFVRSDWEKVLSLAGIFPPTCPVPKGTFTVNNYLLNYSSLPPEAKVGEYKAYIYVLNGLQKVFCLKIFCVFTPAEDDDDDE